MWLGAHPNLPSSVKINGVDVPLDLLIDAAPEQTVGALQGQLPYLFKVLLGSDLEFPYVCFNHPRK